MASLVARALTPESPQGEARAQRRGIDRVLRTSFWQSPVASRSADVIPITTRTARGDARARPVPPRG
jgi:hypothetical protein